jgi:hypothetical protein
MTSDADVRHGLEHLFAAIDAKNIDIRPLYTT